MTDSTPSLGPDEDPDVDLTLQESSDASTATGPSGPTGPVGDTLPEDLDLNVALVGPYTFPDVKRRRIAAYVYLAIAALSALLWFATEQWGFVLGAILLMVVAAYQFLCAWPLKVDQTEALAVASRTVGFPIGHSSAQLAWRGLRSRPSWRVLIYSADEPPSVRGLVELDGVDGTVLGEYTEHNPEDWSKFGRS